MSAQANRQGELRGLLLEIQADLDSMKKLIDTLDEILKDEGSRSIPSTGSQMGMALCLHHIYTAIEEIFLRINKVYDDIPVSSDSWHKELLRNMSLNVDDVRPPVISNNLMSRIDEYRAFRHMIRHAYDYELDWSKLKHLIDNVPSTSRQFETEITTFTAFVQENIRQLKEHD